MELQYVFAIKRRNHENNIRTNSFFIAEIINIYTEDKFLTNGNPDIKKINPFLLTMPDNNFWAVRENIGKAWDAGKN